MNNMYVPEFLDVQEQYNRMLEYRNKWKEAKESVAIRNGLQGLKLKVRFGELGEHKALWISWSKYGTVFTRQISWNPKEDSSNKIKYDWVFEAAREYYKEKEYFKQFFNKNLIY